ncbi:MAG: transglutaminase-like domain-containing protein [Rhodopirellula sp. JB044]|uniref:transglutaminase-like domain-containing protein n=1 Tax=Rhodopirellula sp. JB044 TaxID=3342844 RepID=UPI00370AD7EA
MANLVKAWTADCEHPLEKLQAIVYRLRNEFTFDRTFAADSDTPVSEFLKTKRGGDHLFATTATLMAREIGLSSRLVTGFYVRPTAIDVGAGHSNVLPEDVHVWPEIQLADGRWFEIEPTPTFREPIYHPSMWLVTKRFAAAYWIHGLVLFAVLAVLYVTRLTWIDLGLGVLYPVGSMVWPRGRMSLAMRILQTRAKLAGCPRRPGLPQRDWLLSLTSTHASLRESAARFCDAADRAAFSSLPGALHQPSLSNELLMNLNIKTIRRLASEPRS